MELLKLMNYIVSIIFFVCYFYQFIYIPIVIFFRKRSEKKKKEKLKSCLEIHDLAVLISARNESAVIADLLDSLGKQTYPKERLHVFVIADNCTDDTAEIARAHGATVYERENHELVGKGYALTALFGHLREDYPAGFDGYLVFDADNILTTDYIERMNECFCLGNDIITSYRNSKNYGSSWVSAGHALWFLRESRYLNHARSILGASSSVSGTGFFFSRKIAEENGGWPYHLMTEDLEFSVDEIVKGRTIAFAADAMLYDEQPIKFSQSWRQRKRWGKGYLQVLKKYVPKMIKGIFKGSFSCFDVLMNIAPAYLLTLFSVACNVTLMIVGVIRGENPLIAVLSFGQLMLNCYLVSFVIGLITLITEWKVISATPFRKILSAFTFPIYMLTFIPISIASIFAKASWKPIEHTQSMQKMESEGVKIDLEGKELE